MKGCNSIIGILEDSIFLISLALTVIVLNVLKTPSPTTSASTENVTSKLFLCQIFKDLLLNLYNKCNDVEFMHVFMPQVRNIINEKGKLDINFINSLTKGLNNDYIEKIIDFININNPQKLIIIGYTDSDGTDKHNLELSMNRALEIKSLLMDKNIKANIETIGKGKDNPIASNANVQGKSKNRRVEIIFE